MSAITFENAHEYNAPQFYAYPNEEVGVWREYLKGIPCHRAAGICSSGEVGFFAMLPSVRKELVLIDHSYDSLACAMVKYLIIKKHGPRKARALFTGKDTKALSDALDAAARALPAEVKAAYEKMNQPRPLSPAYEEYYRKYRGDAYVEALKAPRKFASKLGGVGKEWQNTPTTLLRAASTKLDKVKFVHGDLTDLVERGPFDVLYLSNALEHENRDHRSPTLDQIEKAVKPGGHVILAMSFYRYVENTVPKNWTLVKTSKKDRLAPTAPGKLRWQQVLYKTPTL